MQTTDLSSRTATMSQTDHRTGAQTESMPYMLRLGIALAFASLCILAVGTELGQSHGTRPHWVRHVDITEYYPAPERWAVGAPVRAPGLRGTYRVDWLYSALNSLSMEGDGIDRQNRRLHIEVSGPQGWVTEAGSPAPIRKWDSRPPYWRALGWRNKRGAVTFPLADGGWSRGRGVRFIRPRGIRFAPGPSLPLRYWRSLATDPRVIPRGSKVYIPAYRQSPGGGWFLAQDTGGAIDGRRVDVYRPPPRTPGGARSFSDQPVYVIPPG